MKPTRGEQVWWTSGVHLQTGVLVDVPGDGSATVNYQGMHFQLRDDEVHTFKRSALEAALIRYQTELRNQSAAVLKATHAMLVLLGMVNDIAKELRGEPVVPT